MKTAYEYVSDALDDLYLLRQCKLSIKSEKLLSEAEIALTDLLDSVDPDSSK